MFSASTGVATAKATTTAVRTTAVTTASRELTIYFVTVSTLYGKLKPLNSLTRYAADILTCNRRC